MFSQYDSLNRKEPCGRYVAKPEVKSTKDEVELYEEAEPLQQKIENLRTKIALQERYNAALKDNMEETATGNFSVLRGIFAEVHNLRVQLREAVNKEKWAVNNALRTHRLFQLALKQCTPNEAMEWITDRLFDNAKLLNNHLDRLVRKRKRLEESEAAVTVLEKWPIPGSLPWEVSMEEKMQQLLVEQSNMTMKLECAKMLCVKYRAIRGRLRDERLLYQPVLRNLNSQLTFQLSEVSKLEQMLGYAQKFQKDAESTLEFTEREASISRKLRRAQISRMRREMQKIVREEQMAMQGHGKQGHRKSEIRKDSTFDTTTKHHTHAEGFLHQDSSSILLQDTEELQLNERLQQKRAVIDTFNENAAMLVDVMKIPNLTHIPKRMETVITLTDMLKEETASKEILKNNLIKQRDQLMQLYCVIRYTGNNRVTQNELVIQDFEKTLKELERESAIEQEALNQDSELLMDVQFGITALMQRIEGLDRKPVHIKSTLHLINILPIFYDKLEALVQSWKQLKKEMPGTVDTTVQYRRHTQQRNTALIQQVPAKFIRVGDNVDVEEVSDEEEFEDFRVPGRLELKMKSQKIVEQGLLKLGIALSQKQTKPVVVKRSVGSRSASISGPRKSIQTPVIEMTSTVNV